MFATNEVRTEIMDGLEQVVAMLRSVGVFKEIYVDGSFVTDKVEPGDVDVCAPMDDADFPVFAMHPHALKLADDQLMKNTHKVQLFLGPRGVTLIQFFKGLKARDALLRGVAPSTKRGILKVIL